MVELRNIKLSERSQHPPPKKISCTVSIHNGQTVEPKDYQIPGGPARGIRISAWYLLSKGFPLGMTKYSGKSCGNGYAQYVS